MGSLAVTLSEAGRPRLFLCVVLTDVGIVSIWLTRWFLGRACELGDGPVSAHAGYDVIHRRRLRSQTYDSVLVSQLGKEKTWTESQAGRFKSYVGSFPSSCRCRSILSKQRLAAAIGNLF